MLRILLALALLSLSIPAAQAKSPPPGTGVQDVHANILIMLDTSGSMDTLVSSGDSRYPVDVAFDSQGNIYIAKHYDEVEKYDSNGDYVLEWGGYGSGNGKFDHTFAIAIDSNDNIWVSDRDHGRIQKFNTNGTYLSKITLTGSGDDVVYGVAVDSADNLYAVNENGTVKKYSSGGTLLATWSNTGARHIAIDANDNVYVAKYGGSNKVEKYNTSGVLQSSFSVSYDPWGIETDQDGNLYVTAINSDKIYKYSPSGTQLGVWGSEGDDQGEFNSPRGVAMDGSNTIWVADFYNHRIQSPDGNFLINPEDPKTRLEVMQDVIKAIVSDSDLTGGADFGLMQWNSSASMEVNVSPTGASEIFAMVDSLEADGGTYLDNAMTLAKTYFEGGDSPMIEGATCQQNILIVISDGFWVDTTASATAAGLLDDHGIKTFTVGFQTTGNENYVTLSTEGGTYPDSPLYANNEEHMLEVLTNYIQQIITSQLTFTAPVILPGVTNDDHILQATFTYKNEHQWKGHLYKYALGDDGTVGSLLWDAGAVLNSTTSGNRNIWTVGNGIPAGLNNFTTDNLDRLRDPLEENSGASYTDEQLTALINFVRGADSYGEFPTGQDDEGTTLIANERWKLADVYHSKPVAVGAPSAHASEEAQEHSEAHYRFDNGYIAFRNGNTCGGSCASREEVIYVGSNSGMLHAFSSADGAEKWAFVPPSVIPSFKDMIGLATGESNSIFGVDGSPVVKDIFYGGAWHTVLMSGLRQGGHSYFALDITDPDSPQHLFTIAHNTLNGTVSYWDSAGTRTTYDAADTIPSAFDYSELGEAWSDPVITKIPISGVDTWVAIIGGGFNNAINPSYGAKLFVLDLENGGQILQTVDIPDGDGSNGIVTSVAPRVTAITADSTTLFQYNGALVYVTDLEGHLWKINLTDQGTMYEATRVFDGESTIDNDRLMFHETVASIGSSNELVQLFGTANMQNLGRVDADIQNRAYGVFDKVFPAYASVAPFTVSTMLNVTAPGAGCPSGSQDGWYINLDPNEKITAKLTVKNDIIFIPRYIPDSEQICQAGTATLTEHNFMCGDTVRTTSLGSGLPTEVVVYKNKVYIGISSDAEGSLPEGFTKQGNLIVGDPAVISSGTVTIESWREEF